MFGQLFTGALQGRATPRIPQGGAETFVVSPIVLHGGSPLPLQFVNKKCVPSPHLRDKIRFRNTGRGNAFSVR